MGEDFTMNIIKSTQRYEAWLAKRLNLLPADLALKHQAMAAQIFPFFRATFYRWMQLWPDVCKSCARAPELLAVGDLHVENFGTWRDVEGRLVWGINDFDEAYQLPYTLDLVRLAASAHLAIADAHLRIEARDACDAILSGYTDSIEKGGRAYVLEEHHGWLRRMVSGVLRDPEHFWAKFDALKTLSMKVVPSSALRALDRMMPRMSPADKLTYRVVHRVAGLGSLGRERYVAVADYRGGKIAREAKALAPSACVWTASGNASNRIRYQQVLDQSVRAPDPFVRLKGRWIVRRLAPDCSRVELSSIPKERDESRLLFAMGFETANVHLGTERVARKILNDLKKRPRHWLHEAAAQMVAATDKDWHAWRKHSGARPPQ
jgi:hypothetical protein